MSAKSSGEVRCLITRLAETKVRCFFTRLLPNIVTSYKLPSKTLRAYEVDFLVFSGTALPTSRFVSSSVIKANHSAILTIECVRLESFKSVLKTGETLGCSPV